MNETLIEQMKATQKFFNRSTGALAEEDSGYVPGDGAYTAANQIAHVAQTIDWFVEGAFDPQGFNMDFEAHDKEVRAVTSIDEARVWFKRAIENAVKQLEGKSEEEWGQPLPHGPVMGGQPRSSVFAVLLPWGSDTPVAAGQNGIFRPVQTACVIRDAIAVRPA